jgi:tetratricopeptide (TPR) repeat protein
MGAVYKARDREVDRFVALKVIRPELASRPDILARFKQELILARQVTHKNVIRIFDLGEADGVKYITMDFVEGHDLKTLLREKGKFTSEESVRIITQICRALDAAHTEGVVHRDLKPQNIMLDGKGRVTVMDFGIARSLEMPGMTQTGALVGTPEYMSPEQAKGEEVDARSDLFTTGIIFYELLTGRTPFRADTAYATLLKRTQERARPPVELDPTIPPQISSVVMKCLETDRDHRYASALEIVHDLGQQTVTLSRTAPPAVVVPTAPTGLAAVLQHRKWIAGGAGLIILLAVAFVFRDHLLPGAGGRRGAGPTTQVTLAILPFRNASGDHTLDWLGSSLAEMLRTDVGESSEFHTVSPERMHQILSDLRISPDSELDGGTLRRIAEFTSADRVLSGQYVRLGEQIRIDASLQDLKQNRTISLKAEAPDEKQLLGSVNQLAKSIQQNLTLAPEAVKEMQASAFTPSSKSSEAIREYSGGLDLWRQGNYLEAAKRFEAATKDDPSFALAFSLLGQTYHNLGYDEQALQYSNQAVDQSGNLPPTERYMIQAVNARLQNNFDKAIEAYDNLSKLLPNDPQVQFELGALYESHGALDQAHEHYARVVQSDPKYVEALLAVGRVETKRGNPQAALDYLNRALSSAVELNNQQGKANALQSLGVAYRLLNKPDDALRNDQESLAIKTQIGDKRGMAASLDEIAQVHNMLGKPDQAAKDYQEVLKLEKEVGDQAGIGIALMNLGDIYSGVGRFDDALNAAKEALQIQIALGDENSQALSLNNIGMIYFNKAQYDDALTYLQRSLDLRQKLKVSSDIAQTMNNVGEAYRMLGQYDKALDSYLHALELSRAAGDKRQTGAISDSMASFFEQQGRFGAALNAQQDALSNFQQLQERSADMAMIVADYGNALTLLGRGDEAQKSLDEALKLARSVQNDSVIAAVLNLQGDRYFYAGGFSAARPLYDQALQVSSKAKDSQGILLSKFNLARLSIKDGHASSAASSLKALAKEADAKGLKYLSAQCSVSLGEALVSLKNYPQARQELELALQKSQSLGLKSLMAQGHYLLGLALSASGNKSDAAAHFQQATKLLVEIHRESGADAILKRTDLRPIAEEASHKS